MRKKKNMGQWFNPLTIESLAKYGALNIPYSTEKFNPLSSWDFIWEIWLLENKHRNYFGYIKLEKKIKDTDLFYLGVQQKIIQVPQQGIFSSLSDILCVNDVYSTPQSWTIKNSLYSITNAESFSEIEITKKGKITNGVLYSTCKGKRTQKKIISPITSSWSFFDLLQKFSKSRKKILRFTLLDELDKIKKNQILRYLGKEKIFFGGKNIEVKNYQQIGEGTLPWLYYVDLQGRLLVAINGFRAYILNPDTLKIHKKSIRKG